MADESSIIINIHAQSDIDEATKQVAEMLQAARDLAASSGKLQQANNTLSTSFQQEAGAANKSVQALKDATKQENLLEKASASMRTELRKVNDQLRELAMQGDTSSETFLLLADRAAKMTDTMGDTQAFINILASDTKNLDTALGVGAGLTGAFNAATSAAALLGGESEALNEAFLKVQAAMSIINGLQQMAAVMDKRSAANVVLRTALTKLFVKEKQKEAIVTGEAAAASGIDAAAKTAQAGATAVATKATWSFTAALLANPVMLIVAGVAALAAGLVALTRHSKKAAEEQRAFNKLQDETKQEIADDKYFTDYAARMAQAQGKSYEEIYKIQRNGLARQKNAEIKAYNEMIARKKAARGKISDEEQKMIDESKDRIEQYTQDLKKIDDDYYINLQKEVHDEEEKRLAKQKEYAQKRREAAIEQYELELQQRQVLENLSKQSSTPVKVKVEVEIEEEEVEDIIDPATYREAMALKMKLEGASEDEIYQYRYNSQKKYLQARMATEQEGTQAWMELNNQLTELEIQNAERVKNIQAEKYQQAMQIAQQALQFIGDMTNEIFGAISDSIQAEIDKLHEYYTTDAAEARENADKKYITEKDLAKKEADLKLKQAKLNKANALFSIGLNTAMSIMSIWADPTAVWAMKVALSAMAATLGATQLAVAAAKPLPQYAKGRKGGKGEYAMVGERGAEIMYVPDGASIIPHNKINDPASWGAYGVPAINMPAMPSTDQDIMRAIAFAQATGQIDYDKIGAALAKHMPQQKAVSVNIDRNGIMVSNGHDSHTFLNTKYSGAW